jgi:hypothetical protein
VSKPYHEVLKPLELVFGRNLKSLEIQARKILGCCKRSFMSSSGGGSENQNADSED